MISLDIPGVGKVDFPDDMSDAEIQKAIETEILPQAKAAQGNPADDYWSGRGEPADERPGVLAQLGGDIRRGASQLGQIGYGLGALGADVVGADQTALDLLERYKQVGEDIQQNNPPVIGSYKNIGSLGDLGRYAVEAVGENALMALPSLVTGGIGALGARSLAEKGAAKFVEAQVAKGVARDVAEKQAGVQVGRAAMAGGVAGAYPPAAGMEMGSIYGNVYEETGQQTPGTAVALGAVAGALDTIGEAMGLRRVFGRELVDTATSSLVKRLGTAAAEQFVTEAPTEALQTILERTAVQLADPNKRVFNDEGITEIIDSALKGGIGGAGVGVVSESAGSILDWAKRRGVEPTQDNLEREAERGDPEALAILRSAGMSDEQVSGLSAGRAAAFVERINARRAAEAGRGVPDPIFPTDAPTGDGTPRGAQQMARREAARIDAEIERRRLEEEGLASGAIDPGAISRRARPVVPDTIQLGDRRVDGRLTAGSAEDEGLAQAVELRGRANLPANITPPVRGMTDEQIVQAQRGMQQPPTAAGAENLYVDPAGQASRFGEVVPEQTGLYLPSPATASRLPLTPEQVAQAQAEADRAQTDAARNVPLSPVNLRASEGRLPQTPAQVGEQRQAGQAFTLAERQRQRAGETVRDTRTGGRPEGGVESQKTVFMDEGRPVEILASRTVNDSTGKAHTIYTVRRFDPRTGQPLADENGDILEYDVLAAKLTQGRYAADPRAAQEFEVAATPPVVGSYIGPDGKKVKPKAEGARADDLQGLPRQTYRETPPDPTVPGAEGPASMPPGRGPVPRAPRPEQGAGPRMDQGSGGRGPNLRGDQTSSEAYARAEALRRKKMWEQAYRQQTQDEQTGEKTDWGKAKSKYENQTKGYSSNFKGADADGWPETDEDGFVMSDAGGPIRFSEKSALIKVLKTLRQQYPDAGLQPAPHPGPMRQTGRGSAEAYWTIQATQPKPAPGQAKPEPEPEAAPQPEPEQPQRPAGEPPALPGRTEDAPEPDAESVPEPEPDTEAVPKPDTESVPSNREIMDAAAGDFEKLNAAVQALTGKAGLNNLSADERRQVRDTLRPAEPERTEDAPKPDTETVPEAKPDTAERARRLDKIADRYEAIGNEERAAWFRDKRDKAPGPYENLDGWERMTKHDEERAAGLHTVTQPSRRGPRAPKLIDSIDSEMIHAGAEGGQSEQNIAEGLKHVPDHVRRAATDKVNELRRLRAERGYDGEDEPPNHMMPWAIGQIDSRISAVQGAYNRYIKFLGAFKLGRNAAKPGKDGKKEKTYTAETVGRELRALQAEIDRPMPTEAELALDLTKWSVFQLDNTINKYGPASEDGSRALAELRSRPGWGNRRPGELIKERQKIIKQLSAARPPANYAELEAQAADLEEDLARDPAWETSVKREFNRQTGKLDNMTPRQIAVMMRESAVEERQRGAALKTKKAKEASEETARSFDWQADRLESKIPKTDTEAVPETDTEDAPEPDTGTVPENREQTIGAVEKALRERRTKPNPAVIARQFDVSEAEAARILATIAGRGGQIIRQVQASKKERAAQAKGEGKATAPRYRLTPQSTGPQTLIDLIASNGGLAPNGDLTAMDLDKVRTPSAGGMLVRQGGMSLDQARELAEESGFIGASDDYQTSDIQDFLDALEDEYRGSRVAADRTTDESPRAQMERAAIRLDIDVNPDWTDAELEAEIDERLGIMGDATPSQSAADAIDDFVDDMLMEMGIFPAANRQAFDIPFGDDQGAGNEEADGGAGAGGEAPSGAGSRVAERPTGEAGDVQEADRIAAEGARDAPGADRQGAARPTPAIEKTDQGDQYVLLGGVSSAPTLKGKGRQKPADEGLFAPKAEPEPEQIDLEEAIADRTPFESTDENFLAALEAVARNEPAKLTPAARNFLIDNGLAVRFGNRLALTEDGQASLAEMREMMADDAAPAPKRTEPVPEDDTESVPADDTEDVPENDTESAPKPAGKGRAPRSASAKMAKRRQDAIDKITPIDPAAVPDPVNGKPVPADVDNSERLLLISCGKAKSDAPGEMPAVARYTGPRFQDINKWVDAHPGQKPKIVILSGKFGFLPDWFPIPNYDQAMSPEKAEAHIKLGIAAEGTVYTHLARTVDAKAPLDILADVETGHQYRDVMIVGGGEYTDVFNAAVTQLVQAGAIAPDAAINRAKGAPGIQRQQMVQWLNAAPTPDWAKPGDTENAPESDTENVPDANPFGDLTDGERIRVILKEPVPMAEGPAYGTNLKGILVKAGGSYFIRPDDTQDVVGPLIADNVVKAHWMPGGAPQKIEPAANAPDGRDWSELSDAELKAFKAPMTATGRGAALEIKRRNEEADAQKLEDAGFPMGAKVRIVGPERLDNTLRKGRTGRIDGSNSIGSAELDPKSYVYVVLDPGDRERTVKREMFRLSELERVDDDVTQTSVPLEGIDALKYALTKWPARIQDALGEGGVPQRLKIDDLGQPRELRPKPNRRQWMNRFFNGLVPENGNEIRRGYGRIYREDDPVNGRRWVIEGRAGKLEYLSNVSRATFTPSTVFAPPPPSEADIDAALAERYGLEKAPDVPAGMKPHYYYDRDGNDAVAYLRHELGERVRLKENGLLGTVSATGAGPMTDHGTWQEIERVEVRWDNGLTQTVHNRDIEAAPFAPIRSEIMERTDTVSKKDTGYVPKKGTKRDIDGMIVVATGDPDKPWAGGKYIEKGPKSGWQPDTALGYGDTPEAAAVAVRDNRRQAAADQQKRTTEVENFADLAKRAGQGIPVTPDEARGVSRYGDGLVSTTHGKAFLRAMGLTAKQADETINKARTVTQAGGGAWLYDIQALAEVGQQALGFNRPAPKSRKRLSIFDRLRRVEDPVEPTAAERAAADAEWRQQLEQLAPKAETAEDIRAILAENVQLGILDKPTADGISAILGRVPTQALKGVRLVVQSRLERHELDILGDDTREGARMQGAYVIFDNDPDLKVLIVQAKAGSRQGVHSFLHENAHALFDIISSEHKAEARRIYDSLAITRQALHTVNYSKDERFEEWFAESMADHYIGQVKVPANQTLAKRLDELVNRVFKAIVNVFTGEKAQVQAFFEGLEYGLGRGEGARQPGAATRRSQRPIEPFAILTRPVSTLIGEPRAWRMGAQELARDVTDIWKARGTRANRQSFLGGLARAYAFSADGEFRSAISRFNSPTLNLLADTFHAQAGSPQRIDPELAKKLGMKLGSNATFDESVTRRASVELQHLDRILRPFREDEAAMDRIVTLVQNPGSRRGGPESDAASQIAVMLKSLHKYMTDSGVDVGTVKNGYFPREIDQAEVMKDAAGFLEAATKVYKASGLDAKAAKEAAENWQTTILYGGEGSPVRKAGGTSASFVQSRVLTKQADQIMAKFYQRDPDLILGSYINRAVKRAEIARRFGDNWSNWGAFEAQIRREDPAAGGMLDHLRSYAATAAGVQQHGVHGLIRSGSSLVRTFTTLSLLEKSTFASIAEVITPMLRSGSVADFLPAIGQTLNELRRELADLPPSLAADLAADVGAIAGSGVNSIMAARFAGGDPLGRAQARVLSSYFRRIGLEQWTNATRVAATERGAVFLRRLARDVAGAGLNPKSSRLFLAELGVDPKQTDEFVRFVNGFGDNLPTPEQLTQAGEMGEVYRTGILRFVDQTIMRPSATTRPRWASHPIGAVAFQLQAFTYAFSKNVLLRSARLAKRAVTEEDLTYVDRAMFLAPLMMLPALAMTQAIVGSLRDYLFMDPKRREAETRAARIEKAISRAGLTGALDPYIQMVTGARYSKDPVSTLTGPFLGIFGQGLGAGIQMIGNNSPNTNAAERKAVEALYDVLIEPGTNMLLGFAPVAPLTALTTMGLIPAMRDNFVDSLAGERRGHKQQAVYGLSELLAGRQFKAPEGSWAGR